MEPSKELLNNLILGVCHLCERTRELARSGSKDPVAVAPVREAIQMVSTTLEALCSMWEEDVLAALPGEPRGDGCREVDWPGDFLDSIGEGGKA